MQDSINEIPISLYFDLEKNKIADLSVVANVALQWDKLIKEISHIIDPSLTIRVELISGDEGSLWLRAIIKAASKVAKNHPTITGALAAIITTFITTPFNHEIEEIWKKAYEVAGIEWEHKDDISPEDARRIATAVVEMTKNKEAVEIKSKIYSQLESDKSIKGVGSSASIKKKPQFIVKRENFKEMSNPYHGQEENIQRRVKKKNNVKAVLIRPVLIAEPKQWRFERNGKPFSATMNDKNFLQAIHSGHTGIELGQNVEMILDLSIIEEKKNGVWVEASISVEKVVIPESRGQSEINFTYN